MEIKNIKKLSSGKYQITLSSGEKIKTYDEVLLKDNLLYKKELTKEEIDKILKSNSYYDVYHNTVKYVTKKMRSIKEVEDYLTKYGITVSNKNKIINTLKDIGLLNDYSYVKAFISDRIYLSSDGPKKIKEDLLKNRIPLDMIEEELSKIDESELEEKLKKIISKKLKTAKGSNYMIRQKIYNDMQNLGYSKRMIDNCYVDDRDDSSFIIKDFEKAYRDASRKETNEDKVYLKVKQKLYQKGYSLDKIDRVINEKRNI